MSVKPKDNLDELFHGFAAKTKEILTSEIVDYFGINISSDFDCEPAFKIYYKDLYSRSESHPLIDFLKDKDMVRYLTMVHDKEDAARLRFDVGVKNRSDENMEAVFHWLEQHVPLFHAHREEIKQLASMKVTNRDGFQHAGLYFLGFIAMDSDINVLKCHYFNRICSDPDVLHKNLVFDDPYYLQFLRDCGIAPFAQLTNIMEAALLNCGGHMWMTGADYALDGSKKYKLYLKNPTDLYGGLQKTLSTQNSAALTERVRQVEGWNRIHPDYFCEGFAVCLDDRDRLSINFYFKIKEHSAR